MADKKRMGEVLVELGLIDEHRLRHALEVSKKKKTKLGETLIRLGYLSEDQVLGILKNLTGVPIMDMSEGVVKKDAQTIMPSIRMRELCVVPMEVKEKYTLVAFADPLNYITVENVKFLINNDVTPVLASQAQIDDVLNHLDVQGYGVKGLKLSDVKRSIPSLMFQEMSPLNILKLLGKPECTDLHISVGAAPAVRIGGEFHRYNMQIITPAIMRDFLKEVLPDDQRAVLEEKKEVEYTYIKPGVGRYRMNAYYQNGGEISLAVKRLVEDIPTLSSLDIPESLVDLLDKRGLLIVSSARGQGKDTTIAALVDYINATKSCNIITFEDPIVYIHHHKLSNVNQRELGRDTGKDLSEVFDHVMKHDPDVLVISNIKDKHMMETAVLAAQKGILVIAGLNAIDVFSAIEQLISTLSDEYMKSLFARSLLSAFAQRLIWSKTAQKRILVWEQLVATPRIQKYIMDDKLYYIKGQAPALRDEYFPLEKSLSTAVKNGLLKEENIALESWINQDVLRVYIDR